MERASKELMMNIVVISILLSVVYGFLFIYLDKLLNPDTYYMSSPGDFVLFTLTFLVVYPAHIVMSLLSFMAARFAGNNVTTRLIAFNGMGFVLIGVLYYALREPLVLLILFSLLVFSAAAAFHARRTS
ncbi:hypothetical protein [Paenibacillus lemnae]|uniref:Uncharacterized protein n=1 Tax=Paenibacillus lemnae TaxID=1330551 RepID=A0A848M8Y8_PAELE|nr:hypothetical protein [Paenibacillus lemnae]NMO97125.1 hypothetical protein [Paenibacillus lemnae]